MSPGWEQLSFSLHSRCLMHVLGVPHIESELILSSLQGLCAILRNCLCSEPTAYRIRWRNRVVAKFVALWQWWNTSVKCDVSNVLSSSSPVSYWYLRRNFHQWSLFFTWAKYLESHCPWLGILKLICEISYQ